jgi:fumarate hydratase class II
VIGYARATELVARARETGRGLKATAVEDEFVTAAQFDEYTSPEAVCRLGFVAPREGR